MKSQGCLRGLAACAATAAAFGLAAIVAPAAQADGYIDRCAKQKHELVRRSGSALWIKGGSLWGCVAGYTDASSSDEVETFPEESYDATKPVRLGPWSKGSRVAFDGVNAVWAYRKVLRTGEVVDRIYAADVRVGNPWLRSARPAFDLADSQVATLKTGKSFAAWVTTKGTLMAAAETGYGDPAWPDPEHPGDLSLVGTGTAGAAGLTEALKPVDRRLLIGTFPDTATQVQASLRLRPVLSLVNVAAPGIDDECFRVDAWEVTAEPVAGAPRVGAIWQALSLPTVRNCRS